MRTFALALVAILILLTLPWGASAIHPSPLPQAIVHGGTPAFAEKLGGSCRLTMDEPTCSFSFVATNSDIVHTYISTCGEGVCHMTTASAGIDIETPIGMAYYRAEFLYGVRTSGGGWGWYPVEGGLMHVTAFRDYFDLHVNGIQTTAPLFIYVTGGHPYEG